MEPNPNGPLRKLRLSSFLILRFMFRVDDISRVELKGG